MSNRKQHVIKMAHQLFIDKGFQSTSIQDILEYSGISKGTFYNYFSSKNELLIALFTSIFVEMEKARNEILIAQDPSDIEIFIKQLELQMITNKKNKLFTLFEEVLFLDDPELKQFIKEAQLKRLKWTFERFLVIFGEDKKPYLLDAAIMFISILQHNMKYYALGHESNNAVYKVVRYSVRRIEGMVQELSESNEQLNEPELLYSWLPNSEKNNGSFQEKLNQTIIALKKDVNKHEEKIMYIELLDFIQDELLHTKNPRKFIIESALFSLKSHIPVFNKKQIDILDQLVSDYFM